MCLRYTVFTFSLGGLYICTSHLDHIFPLDPRNLLFPFFSQISFSSLESLPPQTKERIFSLFFELFLLWVSQRDHMTRNLLWLIYFTYQDGLKFHLLCYKWPKFIFLYCYIVLFCVYMPHFVLYLLMSI